MGIDNNLKIGEALWLRRFFCSFNLVVDRTQHAASLHCVV